MVFTEQGVAMLSSVLRTEKAVQMNIGIMRAFAYYRHMLQESKELKKEIDELDSKLNQAFKYLIGRLDALTPKQAGKPRPKIGYKRQNEGGWKRTGSNTYCPLLQNHI